jgi:hypothetical protein
MNVLVAWILDTGCVIVLQCSAKPDLTILTHKLNLKNYDSKMFLIV